MAKVGLKTRPRSPGKTILQRVEGRGRFAQWRNSQCSAPCCDPRTSILCPWSARLRESSWHTAPPRAAQCRPCGRPRRQNPRTTSAGRRRASFRVDVPSVAVFRFVTPSANALRVSASILTPSIEAIESPRIILEAVSILLRDASLKESATRWVSSRRVSSLRPPLCFLFSSSSSSAIRAFALLNSSHGELLTLFRGS